MLSPLLIVLLGIFTGGIVLGLLQSFGYFQAVGLTEFTWKYYQEVFMSEAFLKSLHFSLYTSFVSSIIAVIFGILLSYTIYQIKGKKTAIEHLYKVPIAVPHLVAALLVYNLLSQSGILPRILYVLGFIHDQSQFPSLLYEPNGIGIILAYIWKEIPFVALTTYAILGKISNQYVEVAYNLGANKRQVFFHVLLPFIGPAAFSSFIIIFAFSFGAYEVPLLLGPTEPKALAVRAYVEYSNPMLKNRPYAMAMNMLITGISFILTWFYFKAFERIRKFSR